MNLNSFISEHLLTGFESTYMPGVGTDVLEGTRHNERFRHDLELVKSLGIRTLRYPASWNYVERAPGCYDWSRIDEKMAALLELELTPIIDFVHHTAIPDQVLPGGCGDPDLAERLREFALRFVERYPWVTQYTVFNEPYLTTQFCGEMALWYPYRQGAESFVQMALNVGRATALTSRALAEQVPGARFVHVETCESHAPLDADNPRDVEQAAFMSERRFLFDDLLLGRIDPEHSLFFYLLEHGAREADLRWFVEHPTPIHVRGLNYYRQSELRWDSERRHYPTEARRGFAAVAMDYVERYSLPVMLSETNFFGSGDERVCWFKSMLREYVLLREMTLLAHGFCWFPFVSSTDFQHLLQKCNRDRDPVGIYDLDVECWERTPSDLLHVLSSIALGKFATVDALGD